MAIAGARIWCCWWWWAWRPRSADRAPAAGRSHEAKTNLKGPWSRQGPDTDALCSACASRSATPTATLLDWARAIDACQKVLVADPINIDARKLKKLAEKEVAQKKIYEGARHLLDLGEFQEAMQEYLKIDSDSFYWRLARSEFRRAAPQAP